MKKKHVFIHDTLIDEGLISAMENRREKKEREKERNENEEGKRVEEKGEGK